MSYGKEDKVCNNDDFDILQHEYDFLFIDFEKLMLKCKNLKKIITTFTIDLDNAKNNYEIVISNRNNLEDACNNAKFEIKSLRTELENKDKALIISMNENSSLKIVYS